MSGWSIVLFFSHHCVKNCMLGSIVGVIWSGVKALNIYIQVKLSELPLFLRIIYLYYHFPFLEEMICFHDICLSLLKCK